MTAKRKQSRARVRRFEPGTRFELVSRALKRAGVKLTQKFGGRNGYLIDGQHKSHRALVQLADRVRVKRGLEPILWGR